MNIAVQNFLRDSDVVDYKFSDVICARANKMTRLGKSERNRAICMNRRLADKTRVSFHAGRNINRNNRLAHGIYQPNQSERRRANFSEKSRAEYPVNNRVGKAQSYLKSLPSSVAFELLNFYGHSAQNSNLRVQ